MTILRASAVVVGAVLALSLSSCVVEPSPALIDEQTSPVPSPTRTPSPTPTSADGQSEGNFGEGVYAYITFASLDGGATTVSASGYVAGGAPAGGTCTFTFSQMPTVLQAQSDAVADASTLSCPPVTLPLDRFASGSWKVSVEYRLDSRVVASDAVDMELP